MKTIYFEELKRSFLSIKSIIIIILLTIVAMQYGKLSSFFSAKVHVSAESALFSTISTLSLFFTALVFSGIISSISEKKSLRYLLIYQSRKIILIGKYLAMVCYFLILLIGTTFVLIIFAGKFSLDFMSLIQSLCLIFYSTSVILLFSITIKKESMSFFIGIIVGLLLPILGAIGVNSKNLFWSAISWFLPYRYTSTNWGGIIIIIMTIIILFFSLIIFDRKEL